MRPPRDLQERVLAVDKVVNDLTNRLGRPPTVRQIGQALELDDEAVLEAMQAGRAASTTSLSAPRGSAEDGDSTLEAAIGTGEDGFERAEQRVLYEQLAECLTDRERQIVSLRFEHDMTQEAIGKAVGVSQMQVSRALRQAMAKLSAEACAS